MKIHHLITITVFTTTLCFLKGQQTTRRYQPKINRYFKNISEECLKENQVTPERIMAVYTINVNDRRAKCYVACMLFRFNATDIDGNYQDKNLEELMAKRKGSDLSIGMKAVLEKCKNEDDKDRCEKAIKFTRCMYANKNQAGVSNNITQESSANNRRWSSIPRPSMPFIPSMPSIPFGKHSKPWP